MAKQHSETWRGPSKTHFGPKKTASADACPYRSVRHALHCAYASETAEVWGRNLDLYDLGKDDDDPADDNLRLTDFVVSEYLGELSHDPAGSYRDDLTAYEWIGEGVWTLAFIRDKLPPDLMAVLDARFTVADSAPLEVRKNTAAHVVADQVIRAATYARPDPEYCRAAVFDWCGLGELNDDAAQDAFGVGPRTLRRWRNGRQPWGDGIVCTLDAWMTEAEAMLYPVMIRRGLIVVRPVATKWDNGNRRLKQGSASWSGLISLRWRKPSNDERTRELAADVSNDRNEHEAQHRAA